MNRIHALLVLGIIAASGVSIGAQSVISTHSGVINFFEGAVYLNDQPLELHVGRFPTMPVGAELRTAQGRAEVLLTPGVFIRLDERSSVRMVSNDLSDTQVELRNGSAVVDSAEPTPSTSVTLIHKDWRVHFLENGTYRIDTKPPRLRVTRGYAEVRVGADGDAVPVWAGNDLVFANLTAPEPSSGGSTDALDDWSKGRSQSISADNAITQHIDEDSASQSLSIVDSFTYFPFLGLPALGVVGPRAYTPPSFYQPGFNSIYMPGYRYQPFVFGAWRYGSPIFMPGRAPRTGILPSHVPPPSSHPPAASSPVTPAPHPPATRPSPIHSPIRRGGRP